MGFLISPSRGWKNGVYIIDMIYNDLHTNHKDSLHFRWYYRYFPLTFSRLISPTFFSDAKPASMTPEVWMLTASKRHHRRYKVASTQQWNRLHEAACFNRNHQVRGNRKISNKKNTCDTPKQCVRQVTWVTWRWIGFHAQTPKKRNNQFRNENPQGKST